MKQLSKDATMRYSKELNVATTAISVYELHSETLTKMEKIIEGIMAYNADTNLIMFGEAILGWYVPSKMISNAETIPGKTSTKVSEIARKYRIHLCFGMPEVEEGRYYNSQVLINHQGQIIAIHRKWNLKRSEINAGFSKGSNHTTETNILGIRTGMIICSDASNIETMKELRKAKYELLLFSLADDEDKNRLVARLMSKMYRSWIISANRYGKENCYWNGHLVISDRKGELVQSSIETENVLYQKIRINEESKIGMLAKETLKFLSLLLLALCNAKSIINMIK